MKTVSVIIAAYRAESFIEEAVRSVLTQTMPPGFDLQLIVGIDGCDPTYRVISKFYDERLQVHRMKQNVGTYVTFNTMVRFAVGKYIARFDADDIMLDGYLSKQIEMLEEKTDIHLCWTRNQYIDASGKLIEEVPPFKDEWAVRSASDGQFMIRKDAWNELGGFQAWPCNSDTDFLHRLRFLGFKEFGIQEVLFQRRIHADSLTQSGETGYDSPLRQSIREKMFRDLESRKTKEQAWVKPVSGDLEEPSFSSDFESPSQQRVDFVIDRTKNSPPGMDQLSLEQQHEIKHFYESHLKQEEKKNREKQHINAQSTLCLFTSPRGGSTWLGEILSEIPETVLCCEPLFRLQAFSELKFTWHQPIPPGTVWPRAEEIFRQLLNREILRHEIYFQCNPRDIPKASRHIFKFCHGNMLLEWFTDHFAVNPILLVRHPCAVVSSQLRHHGWAHLKHRQDHGFYIQNFPFNDVYALYGDVLKTVKTLEENLAATWCLGMSLSLMSKSNDVKWITVAYEGLYKNYDWEIHRIFNRLGLEIPPSIFKKKRWASKSVSESSVESIATGDQLLNWKKNLTKVQQDNIMGIVKAFGINHYSLEPEPDLSAMYTSKSRT